MQADKGCAKVKETELQRLVMDWLAAKHIFALRMNTGQLRNPAGRPVTFGLPGQADILAFVPTMCSCGDDGDRFIQPWWIELKAGKNGQSELQKSFRRKVESEGHRYILAYSLEYVEAAFQ